jgi:hypothetical protein
MKIRAAALIYLVTTIASPAQTVGHVDATPVESFSAAFWTTTTLHRPSGASDVFTRRTVILRDLAGVYHREIYKVTKGSNHDTSAVLERSMQNRLPSSVDPTSAVDLLLPSTLQSKPVSQSLGSETILGYTAFRTRVTLTEVRKPGQMQVTRTNETWYSPSLRMIIRFESRDNLNNSTVIEMSDLHVAD